MEDELKQAEKHVEDTDREGGCKRNMFLGDCSDCDQYYKSVEYFDLSSLNAAPPSEAQSE